MACVAADGTLTRAGRELLAALEQPRRAEDLAAVLGRPLFRVRASLRELAAAGAVRRVDDELYVAAAVPVLVEA